MTIWDALQDSLISPLPLKPSGERKMINMRFSASTFTSQPALFPTVLWVNIFHYHYLIFLLFPPTFLLQFGFATSAKGERLQVEQTLTSIMQDYFWPVFKNLVTVGCTDGCHVQPTSYNTALWDQDDKWVEACMASKMKLLNLDQSWQNKIK